MRMFQWLSDLQQNKKRNAIYDLLLKSANSYNPIHENDKILTCCLYVLSFHGSLSFLFLIKHERARTNTHTHTHTIYIWAHTDLYLLWQIEVPLTSALSFSFYPFKFLLALYTFAYMLLFTIFINCFFVFVLVLLFEQSFHQMAVFNSSVLFFIFCLSFFLGLQNTSMACSFALKPSNTFS